MVEGALGHTQLCAGEGDVVVRWAGTDIVHKITCVVMNQPGEELIIGADYLHRMNVD